MNGQVVFRPAEVIMFLSKGTENYKNQFSLILAHFMICTYIGVMKYASGDVYEGEFQFIEGSHKFNTDHNTPEYKNEFISMKAGFN